MAGHARDLVRVLDRLGIESTLVVGHSMGGFVAVVLADLFPDRVDRLVLVDGGLPLQAPEGLSPDEVARAILGPAAARLEMRFADTAAYVDFWRPHPALGESWTEDVVEYLLYDLEGEAPTLRPSTSYDVMATDMLDTTQGPALQHALAALRHPAILATAPRGLLNQTPGLYSAEYLAATLPAYPTIRHVPVDDVNHYTIVMSEHGARRIAGLITEALAAVARDQAD